MKYNYKFFNLNNLNFKNYSLKFLNSYEIEKVRKWRNEQINVLRQKKKISFIQQKKYFTSKILREIYSKKPKIILFGFHKFRNLIGYGGITYNNKTASIVEMSFLLDTKRINLRSIYSEDMSIFINLLILFCKQNSLIIKIFTETYFFRYKHIKVLYKNLFKLKGKVNNKSGTYHSLIHVLNIK